MPGFSHGVNQARRDVGPRLVPRRKGNCQRSRGSTGDSRPRRSAAPRKASPWHCPARQVMRELRRIEKPVVFDADSLHLVKTNLELMRGWRSALLTPNRNEFQRLASAFDIKVDPKEPVKKLQEARVLVVLSDRDAETLSPCLTVSCNRAPR